MNSVILSIIKEWIIKIIDYNDKGSYDISRDDFFLLNCFYHFLPQIIDCLHFRSFKSDFASFGSRCWILYVLLEDFSISIYTTSPSTISLSSFILTPIDLRKAWVNAYVLLIYSENIYEPASIVNGTSSPKLFAIAIAIAVLPVPGCPPISTAWPAIFPYFISYKIIPAALLASALIK